MERFIKLTVSSYEQNNIGREYYINPKEIIGFTRSLDDTYTLIYTSKWLYKVVEKPEQILDKIQSL